MDVALTQSSIPATQRSAATRAIALWLLGCCALVLAMVVVGGVTRLTRSGLSIVEWAPILGTLPPVNPNYTDRNASGRNAWVKRVNDAIRVLAQQEQVAIAEIHAEFEKQPSLPPLFTDFVHPNNEGYRLIAKAFFEAITKPYPAASSSGTRSLFPFPARRR